jgi:hypothetical protein
MSRLVLISGPGRSGKNTAGKAIAEFYGADHFAISDRLKVETHSHFGLPGHLAVDHFEDCKDEPNAAFDGMTPRQAYIHVSEEIIKPRLGEDYLGRCALERLADPRFSLKVVSGVGFLDEVLPLVEAVGADRCMHLRIMPARGMGVDIKDSRQVLDLTPHGIATVQLVNTFDASFHDLAIDTVGLFAMTPAANRVTPEFDIALA